jgi:hypothetical protein
MAQLSKKDKSLQSAKSSPSSSLKGFSKKVEEPVSRPDTVNNNGLEFDLSFQFRIKCNITKSSFKSLFKTLTRVVILLCLKIFS